MRSAQVLFPAEGHCQIKVGGPSRARKEVCSIVSNAVPTDGNSASSDDSLANMERRLAASEAALQVYLGLGG